MTDQVGLELDISILTMNIVLINMEVVITQEALSIGDRLSQHSRK